MNNESPSSPKSIVHGVLGSTLGVLILLAVGFLLGFFPAFLGEGGTFAAGVDSGWKFALLFLLALAVGGVVYVLLKPTALPEILKSMAMFMVVWGIMYASGTWLDNGNGNGNSWQWNLLRGMGNGAIIGAAVHGVTVWQAKRRRPTP